MNIKKIMKINWSKIILKPMIAMLFGFGMYHWYLFWNWNTTIILLISLFSSAIIMPLISDFE